MLAILFMLSMYRFRPVYVDATPPPTIHTVAARPIVTHPR